MTSEFPAQMASNTEDVSIWWRHHVNTEKAKLDLMRLRENTYQLI